MSTTSTTAPVDAALVTGALVVAKSLFSAEKARKDQAATLYGLRKDNGGRFTDEEIHAQIVTAHRDLHPARIRATVKAPISLATVSNYAKAHSLHIEAGLPRITDETFRIAYNAIGHAKADRRNAVITAVAALPEGKRESAFVTELTLAVKGKDSALLSDDAKAEVTAAEAAEKAEKDAAPFTGGVKLAERLRDMAKQGKIPAGDVAAIAATLQETLVILAAQDAQASTLARATGARKRTDGKTRGGAKVLTAA